MNAQLSKKIRRDARRLVGEHAVRAIEAQGSALDVAIPNVNALGERTNALKADLDELKTKIKEVDDGILHRAHALSTFRGRFRWLLTGRF